MSNRGSIIALSSGMNATTLIYAGSSVSLDEVVPYPWICDVNHGCQTRDILPHAIDWTISTGKNSYLVQGCLSRLAEEHCKLQCSLLIMCIVIGSNCVKIVCMALVLWCQSSKPLVTLGDAMESFLEKPDPSTEEWDFVSEIYFLTRRVGGSCRTWDRRSHR